MGGEGERGCCCYLCGLLEPCRMPDKHDGPYTQTAHRPHHHASRAPFCGRGPVLLGPLEPVGEKVSALVLQVKHPQVVEVHLANHEAPACKPA